MMKKTFLPFGIAASMLTMAQKTGVATTTPTEVIDVNGTVRIRNLPNDKATNAIYTTGANTNSGATPTQTFTASKTVVVDNNGVMGAVARNAFIFNTATIPATSVAYNNNGSNVPPVTLVSQTFTLSAPAWVTFTASVPIINVYTFSGSNISDGVARILRNSISVDGTRIAAQTQILTNSSTTAAPTGYYYNNITATVQLAAGSHTALLQGSAFYNVSCTMGDIAGAGGSLFQAFANY